MAATEQPGLLSSASHLDWLPDETVHSLASRHHRLSGNARPERTALQLFGHSRGGHPHDLPAGLDQLASSFAGRLGDGTQIALAHTVLPFFLATRSERDRHYALDSIRSPRLGSLKAKFGLLAAGFGATCSLKACLECMSADIEMHGTPYWHLQHQVPGSWICPINQEWLCVSISSRAQQVRYRWTLPKKSDLILPEGLSNDMTAEQIELFRKINRICLSAAASSAQESYPEFSMDRGLWGGMVRCGWASAPGRLNSKVAASQLVRVTKLLSLLPEWDSNVPTEGVCLSRIRSVLKAPDQGNPLRLICVVSCLYDSWDDFLTESNRSELSQSSFDSRSCGSSNQSMARDEFLKEARDSVSVTAMARKFNIAVSTAQAWLTQEGWQTKKRPSKLHGPILHQVIAGLEQGQEPSNLSAELCLSETSIRRVLNTIVGLKVAWKEARSLATRTSARSRWHAALTLASPLGAKVARALDPSAYAWLYRNDQDWLKQNNDGARRASAGNNRVIDWGARDSELSARCQAVAKRLLERGNGRRITLVDVVKEVPELRTKLCKLERLPLTSSTIRHIVQAGGSQMTLELTSAPPKG